MPPTLVEFKDSNNVLRRMNPIPPIRRKADGRPADGTNVLPLIPRTEWDALIDAAPPGPSYPYLPPITDQGSVGQCESEACNNLLLSLRMRQGLPYVQTSPGELYARTNPGTAMNIDFGSSMNTNIWYLQWQGVGLASTYGGTLWDHTARGCPVEERFRYRLFKTWDCPTFDHVVSRILQGFTTVISVGWYSNLGADATGWGPAAGSGLLGMHAQLSYKVARKGSTYGLWCQNSWGAGWGLGGRWIMPESLYWNTYGAMAGRSCSDEGGVIPALSV